MEELRRSLPQASRRPANRLLAALPRTEWQRIAPLLRKTTLKSRDILHRKGEPILHVYFPAGGICSLVMPLDDGSIVEMAMVGCEGVVGTSAALNGNTAQETALVQVPADDCFRMTMIQFRHEMARRRAFEDLVTRYGQATLAFIMQSVACNAMHPVEQRLSRWLLMARDRLNSNRFPLTQELMAALLGISRPTVSLVAGTLRKAGLIEYCDGSLTILNRPRLEDASCECYGVVVAAFKTLVPELVFPDRGSISNRTDRQTSVTHSSLRVI